MKTILRNLKVILLIFICLSITLLIGLYLQQYRSRHELNTAAGENKDALRTRYAQAGTIYDTRGIILAQSVNGERLYAEDDMTSQALLHVVGDYTNNIENTIEGTYQGVLLGNDRNVFRQAILDIFGKGLYGDDIVLTLDSELSAYAYDILDGRRGSVVVMNYTTGDILASVSSPSVMPDHVVTYSEIPDTALFNRAFLGAYAPGSTFKIITASTYMQSAVYDPELTLICDSHSTVDPFGASETGDGHGEITLKDAIARSCNVFFGHIGIQIDKEFFSLQLDRFGFGESIAVDRLYASGGKYFIPENSSTVSWFAIGQPVADSVLYTSPLHLAMIAGAIGNEGAMMVPHVVDYSRTPLGEIYDRSESKIRTEVMSSELALEIETMMIGTTQYGTGTTASVNGYTVAAKTGTVQVEGKKNNALCVAYITEDDMPFVIAVVVEEGGAGGDTAAPIAGRILSKTVDIYTSSTPES